MNHRGLVILIIILLLGLNLVYAGIITAQNNMADETTPAKRDGYETISPSCVKPRGTPRAWDTDEMLEGIDINSLSQSQSYPTVISDKEQYIYCVWQDDRNVDWNIYFTRSANSGNLWSTNVRISNDSQSQGHQRFPDIAINPKNESHLYVVWQDERNDDGDIYFSYSTDRGDTWANESIINSGTPDDTSQWNPKVACDSSGNIYVVWSDNFKDSVGPEILGDWNIKLSKSVDQGKSWSNPILVNDPYLDNIDQTMPDIAIDKNGIIHVTWEDDRNDDKKIFYSRSINAGASFSNDIQVSNNKAFRKDKEPDIAVDEYNNILIVWLEDYNSHYNVYFTKSLDFGETFETIVQVNDILDKCNADADPAVLADDRGNIYVAWTDQRAENHIYSGYSLDNGKSFTVNEKIDGADNSSATGKSVTTQEQLYRGQAGLIQLKNKIFTFWTDYRNDPNPDDDQMDNGDIYYDMNFSDINRVPEKPEFVPSLTTKGWWFIDLNWEKAQVLDFAKYKIYMSIIDDFTPDLSTLNSTITDRLQNNLNITNLAASTTYYFYLEIVDQFGFSSISERFAISTKANIPPKIGFIEPDGNQDLVDSSFEIIWWDNDPDDNASITLYYDTDQNPRNGMKLIVEVLWGEDSNINSYLWDTSKVSNGSYLIVAVVADISNGEQDPVHSANKVTIYHGNQDPWLFISFFSPNNITGIGLTESVVMIFNKHIDLDTLTPDNFKIKDLHGNIVAGDFEFDKSTNKLLFNPIIPYNGSERYYVNLTTDIQDESNIFSLNHDYSWWFETVEVTKKNGTIQGEVVDEDDKALVSGAVVILTDLSTNITREYTTGPDGLYLFNVEYGEYELEVIADQFQPTSKVVIALDQESFEVNRVQLIRPKIVNFKMDSKITMDEKLEVSAYATHPNNESMSYIWDFGDGSQNEYGQKLSHKYEETGIFKVTLTVVDENGGRTSRTETVEVEAESTSDLETFIIIGVLGLIILILMMFLALRSASKRQAEKLEEFESRISAEEEEESEEEESEEEEPEEEEPEEEEPEEEEPEEEEPEEEEPEEEPGEEEELGEEEAVKIVESEEEEPKQKPVPVEEAKEKKISKIKKMKQKKSKLKSQPKQEKKISGKKKKISKIKETPKTKIKIKKRPVKKKG